MPIAAKHNIKETLYILNCLKVTSDSSDYLTTFYTELFYIRCIITQGNLST